MSNERRSKRQTKNRALLKELNNCVIYVEINQVDRMPDERL
jgi:hypothetical protein